MDDKLERILLHDIVSFNDAQKLIGLLKDNDLTHVLYESLVGRERVIEELEDRIFELEEQLDKLVA
jgi:hypothetical protein